MSKIIAPSLEEMKERQCSIEELQAKLIDFIDHYNSEVRKINDAFQEIENAINLKEDRIWRATI